METLPLMVTVSLTTVELFLNQLITGRGRPSAAHFRATTAVPDFNFTVLSWGCIVKKGFHVTNT